MTVDPVLADTGNTPMIGFEAVSKVYDNGTVALDAVTFDVQRQTIHAICGENGAGKSTLMKILFGFERPSSGSVSLRGRPVEIASPRQASSLGIGMVHQHFYLVPSMSVAENVALGHEPRRGALMDRDCARRRVVALGERYNLKVDPAALCRDLSVAAQQKVEILKALSRDVEILILDEPTAVLTPQETDQLFAQLQTLRDGGLTILFISHKLREVRAFAAHVTVLRRGRMMMSGALSRFTDEMITTLIMGHRMETEPRPSKAAPGATLLDMARVSIDSTDPGLRLHDITLRVCRSEIVGVAGVDGSGQKALTSLLSGKATPSSGQIRVMDRPIDGLGTAALRSRGIVHLPADRFVEGGAPAMSLVDNVAVEAPRRFRTRIGPILVRRAMRAMTRHLAELYDVRFSHLAQSLGSLSGGNAQKLIAAREFAANPTLLIADQPTRGIDAGAAAFLHSRLRRLAEEGVGILLVTADLDELLALSDRIVVLFAGRITASFDNHPALTPEDLGPAMLGLKAAA